MLIAFDRFLGKMGVKMWNFVFGTPETTLFDVLIVKIGAESLAVRLRQNKKSSRVALYAVRGRKRAFSDRTEILHRVGVPDVITYAKFSDHRLGFFERAWVAFSHFPLTFMSSSKHVSKVK